MVTNEARVGIEDIPVNQIENHMASNGNMNPVYVQNMAAMAAVGTSSVDIDMDNSDTDDVEHRHEVSPKEFFSPSSNRQHIEASFR
jgi:hypothetical protein